MTRLIFLALALLPSTADAQTLFGHATAIDGDTLVLGEERIRLHGVDALEATQTCARNEETRECGYEATQLLAKLVEGRMLQCRQRDRDSYDRVVATCTVGGLDLAGALVDAGLAVALPQYSAAYLAREAQARTKGIGMWGSSFQVPADFRAANPRLENVTARSALVPARPVILPSTQQRANRSSGNAYFRNCAAARSAGAAPLRVGEAGYRTELDADGDGVACEPHRAR